MKKLIYLLPLLALVFCAVSCQDKGLDSKEPVSISAVISDPMASRVTLADNGTTLSPSWTLGDEVFGFDEAGNTFTFTVTDIVAGRATMSAGGYVAVDGRKVYAIYAPGKSVSDISENQLEVSIATQDGILDETAPFLMCATAVVDGTSISLSFENKVAVVGLKKFKVNPATAAMTVDHLLLDGAIAAGTFQVVGGNLELVPAGAPATITAAGTWETDATGLYDAPVYFAVLPTADANLELHAASGSDSYVNLASIAQTTLEAGYYYRMSKILDAVAEVEGVKYADLGDAWTAAKSATGNVTVTLLANCTHNSQLDFGNANDKTITLDLNGKILTTETAQFLTSASAGKSLIIKDTGSPKGKITSSAKNIIYLNVANTSVELNGCIIESTATSQSSSSEAPICISYSTTTNKPQITIGNGARVYTINAVTTVYCKAGRYSINECEITSGSEGTAGKNCIYTAAAASIVINDGASLYTTGSSSALYVGSKSNDALIEVKGGYYNSKSSTSIAAGSGYSSAVSVCGGYFKEDISKTASLSEATINGQIAPCTKSHTHQTTSESLNYSYMCSVASISEANYEYLAEAISAANSADENVTLKLLSDLEYNSKIDLSNEHNHTITFDLNGHTLSTTTVSASGTQVGFLSTTKTLIVKNGTITSSGNSVITNNSGNLTISDCAISTTYNGGSSTTYNYRIIRAGGGTTTINKSVLTANNASGIYAAGTINLNGVTLTGKYYGIYAAKNAAVTISNYDETPSSIYSSSQVTLYLGDAGAVTVNSGFFYRNTTGSGNVVSAGSGYESGFTFNGGYFSKELPALSGATGRNNVQLLGTPMSHDHDATHTGLSYTYGYSAETEAQASTSSPVASYGAARTGGVSF